MRLIDDELFLNYGQSDDSELFASHGFTLAIPTPFVAYAEGS
jgi:hypothetical protein